MNPRLNIQLHPAPLDKYLNKAAFITLIFMWSFSLFAFFNMPAIIPIHFNAAGEVDSYGGKTTIFLLPGIATIIYTLFTVLGKYPHLFNYPTAITRENAERQYRMGTRLMRFIRLSILVVFTMVVVLTYLVGTGRTRTIGAWFLPLIIAITVLPAVYYLIKMWRAG
jgi:uncharacterized membrane protein